MATILDEFGIEALKTSGKLNIPKSRKEKLQAELQLLEWHKMANAAAIKGALLQTKSLKQQTREQPKVQPFQVEEDSKWIKKVIQQEHIKPLEVSKDYVLEYERREKENAERLANQVDRHIGTLKQLRMKLEARHDLKVRTEEYRNWQKDFLPKKHAVMIGKTIDEIESKSPTTNQKEIDEINDELMNRTLNKSNHQSSSQELSNVLDSLSKLADLEKRISSLEKENRHDEMMRKESPTANQRTQFEFRKKRSQIQEIDQDTNAVTSALNNNQSKGPGPVGMVYEIRPKKSLPQQPQSKFKVNLPSGNGAMAVKAKRSQTFEADEYETDDYADDHGGGGRTFITAQASEDNLHRQREEKRKERLRQREVAPAGVKSLKSRVQIKKVRQKEMAIGARKHEEAMKEMNRRKAEQLQKKTGNAPPARRQVAAPAKGIASGIKTKNKHLQEFQKMKSGYEKRKDEINKRAVVRGGVEDRLQSQTVPIYSSKTAAAKSRYPPVGRSAAGGITRRTGNPLPTKRPQQTQPLPAIHKDKPIAVTGINGLRAIQSQRR